MTKWIAKRDDFKTHMWDIVADNGRVITSVTGTLSMAKQTETTANLIAAAPMMRDALIAMLADYRSEGCAKPNCSICRKSRAAEMAARAAIRMSQGEIVL